eukprot:TRINITY_DN783_c3_g1_i1.p1 TRINITY_DN783_c3_g1~~TRINITY_DN783_c3_g1_i1.p1  ORF type:complete len:501 (+),score=192.04 TRINITY_DN783_c3_g1_i1:44-1546(+)
MGIEEDHVNGYAVKEEGSIFMWLALLATSCATFTFGFSLGFTSPVFTPDGNTTCYDPPCSGQFEHYLDREMNLTSDQTTWFSSVINLGAGGFAIFGGGPVDRFGKKWGMVAAHLFYILGWGLLLSVKAVREDESNTSHVTQLYFARVIIGFGIGLTCCSVSNYQTEICTLKLRGVFGSCFQIAIVTGIFTVYALGLKIYWRTLCVIVMCVEGVGLLLTFFLPESPVWLLSKSRREDAELSLMTFRSKDSSIEKLMANIADVVDKGDESQGGFKELMQAPRFKALCIGVGLMFVQQLSGINAVMFYANMILGKVWSDPDTVNNYAVGAQGLQLVVTIATSPFMDKAGRRPLLVFACVGMVISCAVMNVFFFDSGSAKPAFAVVGFYMYIASFAMGMGAIPWFIMGEIFHPEVKGISSSIATAFNWSLSFAVTKTIQNLVDAFSSDQNVGMGWVFTLYGSVCFVGIAFILLFIPETKGKPYAQVEAELLGNKGYIAVENDYE